MSAPPVLDWAQRLQAIAQSGLAYTPQPFDRLRYEDVLDAEGKVRSEIRLDPEQTKGQHGRVVFVSEKLLRELAAYVKAVPCKSLQDKLFYTQKRPGEGFSANTLTQFFKRTLCDSCRIAAYIIHCVAIGIFKRFVTFYSTVRTTNVAVHCNISVYRSCHSKRI